MSHVETMYEICTHFRGHAGEIEKLKSHKMMSVVLITIRLDASLNHLPEKHKTSECIDIIAMEL